MIKDNLRLEVPAYFPEEETAIDVLDMGPFEFFLAGSRYMGCARPNSDWDFIAQDSDPLRNYLERVGFKPLFTNYGDADNNTAWIGEKVSGEHKVQVQLKKDVEKARISRDIIKAHLLQEHIKMDAEQRNWLWNDLYAVLSRKAETIEVLPF